MKTMELQKMDLVELNSAEMVEIVGGSFWGWIAVIGAVVAAVLFGIDFIIEN